MPPDRPKPGFFDLAVPFFLPLWRRVVTVAIPLIWAMVEYANGATLWALLFVALAAIACWKFATADWAAVTAEAENDAQRGR